MQQDTLVKNIDRQQLLPDFTCWKDGTNYYVLLKYEYDFSQAPNFPATHARVKKVNTGEERVMSIEEFEAWQKGKVVIEEKK